MKVVFWAVSVVILCALLSNAQDEDDDYEDVPEDYDDKLGGEENFEDELGEGEEPEEEVEEEEEPEEHEEEEKEEETVKLQFKGSRKQLIFIRMVLSTGTLNYRVLDFWANGKRGFVIAKKRGARKTFLSLYWNSHDIDSIKGGPELNPRSSLLSQSSFRRLRNQGSRLSGLQFADCGFSSESHKFLRSHADFRGNRRKTRTTAFHRTQGLPIQLPKAGQEQTTHRERRRISCLPAKWV